MFFRLCSLIIFYNKRIVKYFPSIIKLVGGIILSGILGFVGNVKRGSFDELGIHNQISKIIKSFGWQSKTEEKTLFVPVEVKKQEKGPLPSSRKPQNLPLRVIQELKKLAVDIEVASVPSQEVENGRRA